MDATPSPGSVDACTVPAAAPPEGMTSNFVHPNETLEMPMIIIGAVTTFLAVLSTVIRVHVNFRKLHAADYFAVTATILMIAFTAVVLAYGHRYSRHLWDVPLCWMTDGTNLKVSAVLISLYGVTAFFSKSAILLLYYQLFWASRAMRLAVYIGLTVATVTYWTAVPVGGTIVLRTVMDPVAIHMIIVQAVIGTALDVYIFVLPLPTLLKLRLERAKRLQLAAVFGTALLAVAASITSLVYRTQLVQVNDGTWHEALSYLTVINEHNIVIMVSGAPAFRAFLAAHSSMFKSLKSKLSSLVHSSESGSSVPTGRIHATQHADMGAPDFPLTIGSAPVRQPVRGRMEVLDETV